MAASFGQVFSTTAKVVLSLLLIGAVLGLIYGIGVGISSVSEANARAEAARASAKAEADAEAAASRARAYAEKWAPIIDRCSQYARRPESKWPKECTELPADIRPLLLKYAPPVSKPRGKPESFAAAVPAAILGPTETAQEREQRLAACEIYAHGGNPLAEPDYCGPVVLQIWAAEKEAKDNQLRLDLCTKGVFDEAYCSKLRAQMATTPTSH